MSRRRPPRWVWFAACALVVAAGAAWWTLARGLPKKRPGRKVAGGLVEIPGIVDDAARVQRERESFPEPSPPPSVAATRAPEMRTDGYATTWDAWDASFSGGNVTNAGARALREAGAALKPIVGVGTPLFGGSGSDRSAEWRRAAGVALADAGRKIAAIDEALQAPSFAHEQQADVLPVRDSTRGWLAALMDAKNVLVARVLATPRRDDRRAALVSLARLAARVQPRNGIECSLVITSRTETALCVRDMMEDGTLGAAALPGEVSAALETPAGLLRRSLLFEIVQFCAFSDWQKTPAGEEYAGRVPESGWVEHPVGGRRLTDSAAQVVDLAIAEDRADHRDRVAWRQRLETQAGGLDGPARTFAFGRRAMVDRYLAADAACGLARLAIEVRRERERTGAWPASVDAVARRVPEGGLVDPYTEKPFLYSVDDEFVRIWSAGPPGGKSARSFDGLHRDVLAWKFPAR